MNKDKYKTCDILAIANQKGGVGKTTTAVNLAAAFALIHYKKVLLIDMDAQGNATTSAGVDKNALEYTIADILLGEIALKDAILSTSAGFDIIGASRDLAGLDVALAAKEAAPLCLKKALDEFLPHSDYDYIIIDCAPSLSLVSINAMVATYGVIIPMQCEYYALEGVADLTYTIQKLHAFNPVLHIRGVVRTLYDARNVLSQDVSAELLAHFGDKLYRTVIPRNVRLAEAPSFGQSIFGHQKSSKGARAYQKLAKEVIDQSEQLSFLA